jgi:hypothetical protein
LENARYNSDTRGIILSGDTEGQPSSIENKAKYTPASGKSKTYLPINTETRNLTMSCAKSQNNSYLN